jgi:hypothetical protein
VLITDTEAEHIPGCNMAFRRDALATVGGFDPQFRVAGDDVDMCWRMQDAGYMLGFSPAASVWHHRRNSVRAYWRQQRGYGKAEALLERKWPERYNASGHVRWAGRLYGRGVALPLSRRQRVHHGKWGLGLFQSVYEPAPGRLSTLPLMPEWYLVIALLAVVSALGAVWMPLLLALPLLGASVATTLAQAVKSTRPAAFPAGPEKLPGGPRALRGLTMGLYLLQPAARLWGRLLYGLSPWRRHQTRSLRPPVPYRVQAWSETWRDPEERARTVERALLHQGARVSRGDAYARWDLEAAVGMLARVRGRLAIEEHGQGRQLIRMRCWPCWPRLGSALTLLLAGASVGAFLDGAPTVGIALAVLAAAVLLRLIFDLAAAAGAFAGAFRHAAASDERAAATAPIKRALSHVADG